MNNQTVYWPNHKPSLYSWKYKEVLNSTLRSYNNSSWKEEAKQILLVWIDEVYNQPNKKNDLYEYCRDGQYIIPLKSANLRQIINSISLKTELADIDLSGALFGEIAAMWFKNSITIERWDFIHSFISNNGTFFETFISIFEEHIKENSELIKRIKVLADQIIDDIINKPIRHIMESEKESFQQQLTYWDKHITLENIWFETTTRSISFCTLYDKNIISFLYRLSPKLAVQVLERVENPILTELILQSSGLHPESIYSNWVELFKHSKSAFNDDGSWNNKCLEPILLRAAERSLYAPAQVQDDPNLKIETEQDEFSNKIISAINSKKNHSALTMRWGTWLFRRVSQSLNSENESYPTNTQKLSWFKWKMCEKLAATEGAVDWINMHPSDESSIQHLCRFAMQIEAADTHRTTTPNTTPILECLPDTPEDFLGKNAEPLRNRTSLFTGVYNRIDSFAYKFFAIPFLHTSSPSETYAELWRKTLTLRELAEYRTGKEELFSNDNEDVRSEAKNTVQFILNLGLSLLDAIAHESLELDMDHDTRANQFLEILNTVYNGFREMQSISEIGLFELDNLLLHLIVRRFNFEIENGKPTTFTKPFNQTDRPTIGHMLGNKAGITPDFFMMLNNLKANGIPIDRITEELKSINVNLDQLRNQAEKINKLDQKSNIDLSLF